MVGGVNQVNFGFLELGSIVWNWLGPILSSWPIEFLHFLFGPVLGHSCKSGPLTVRLDATNAHGTPTLLLPIPTLLCPNACAHTHTHREQRETEEQEEKEHTNSCIKLFENHYLLLSAHSLPPSLVPIVIASHVGKTRWDTNFLPSRFYWGLNFWSVLVVMGLGVTGGQVVYSFYGFRERKQIDRCT
jgi:hypothetical protein